MKVLLVFPPQMQPYAPYLSVPWLGAYLRANGHEVVQRDLNIETYHLFLSDDFLENSLSKTERELSRLENQSALLTEDRAQYRFLSKVVASGDYVIGQVEEAKRVYTSEDFYDPDQLLSSHTIIESALRLAVAPWYPAHFSLSEFHLDPHAVPFPTVNSLVRAVHDDENNPFRSVFKHYFLDSLLEEEPGLIGISIVGYWQIIPGLTLASLISESSDIHVCVGGQSISRWEDLLPREEPFFHLFDSAIIREGEIPLLRLVTALEEDGKGLETVPNLFYRDGDRVRSNPVTEMVDINTLPAPAFDGLPLDLYLMPELMLPLYTSRGCYWRKCAFCDHQYGYENYYVCRDMDLVKKDVTELARKHDTNLFPVVDEITPPQRLRAFAEMLLDADLDIKYFLAQRFEEEYTPELCELLRDSGLVLAIWGLESACQRVLDVMRKGTDVEVNKRVLRNAAEAEIWNYVAVVHGFPSETREEAKETVEFVVNHPDIIKGLYSNVFTVGKWSVVINELDEFDVKVESLGDLCWYYLYYPTSGLSYLDALEVQSELLDEMRQVHSNFEFWNTLEWPHMFLYLSEKGYKETADMCTSASVPQAPTDGWKDVIVKLREGVSQVAHLFDCTGGQMEHIKGEKGHYHALYDLFADRFYFVSWQAAELLRQSGEGKNIGEIASQTSAVTEISPEEVENSYIEFVKNLGRLGLVTYV